MRSTDRAHGCSSASARLDRQPDRTDDRRIQFRPVAELARKAEDWEFPGLLLADSQDLNADIWSNSAWPARRPRGCSSARTCPCRRRRGGRRLALTAGLPRDGAGNRRSAAAANAVTKNGDGTVSVEINALHDAEGLERNLHQGDIPAVVRYLPPDQGRRSDTFTVIIPARSATRSREAGRSRCAGTGVCASRSTKRSPAHCRTDRQRRTPRMAIDPGKVSCPDRYPACSGPRRRCAP
jgi:hypothetical protein